jgi:hypothetical protein
MLRVSRNTNECVQAAAHPAVTEVVTEEPSVIEERDVRLADDGIVHGDPGIHEPRDVVLAPQLGS